jgi:uncharacterized protein
VDCPVEDVRIGLPVQVEFEQHEDVWIPVFRPAAGSQVVGSQVVGSTT